MVFCGGPAVCDVVQGCGDAPLTAQSCWTMMPPARARPIRQILAVLERGTLNSHGVEGGRQILRAVLRSRSRRIGRENGEEGEAGDLDQAHKQKRNDGSRDGELYDARSCVVSAGGSRAHCARAARFISDSPVGGPGSVRVTPTSVFKFDKTNTTYCPNVRSA